jgi:Protein of unknown function (DUF3710)
MVGRRREKRTDRSKLDATPPWETRIRDEPEPTEGPYDERDAPDDGVVRLDLGALQVPVVDGFDVRLEVNEQQQVTGVTLARADGHMQLGVFAAPRREGIWDEVRAELAESLNSQRGVAKHVPGGPFGVELTGKLAADGGGQVPVRFIGIDGPRWFLRAMLVGAPASEPAKAVVFEQALRQVVVVRGSEPLPARDAVPLQLPKEMAAEIEAASQADNPRPI